jgi:hypothetical protein
MKLNLLPMSWHTCYPSPQSVQGEGGVTANIYIQLYKYLVSTVPAREYQLRLTRFLQPYPEP